MTPHYADDAVTLHHGDCINVMRAMPDNSVDSIVTDPPYGLGFMGKAWDELPPGLPWATECLRVLKPGGHLLAFGGTRTWHRLAVAVEDAGFEMRDSIAWLYGSGFPKSLDVSKAIDKAAEGVGFMRPNGRDGYNVTLNRLDRSGESTDAARTWQGWGTALKPAFEPIVVGRKPLAGTVAANVLAHGTGALNIDGCRVGMSDADRAAVDARSGAGKAADGWGTRGERSEGERFTSSPAGRWPANVVLDEDAAAELDAQSGVSRDGVAVQRNLPEAGSQSGDVTVKASTKRAPDVTYGGTGGASRFFYVAKAPTDQRPRDGHTAHPTVKPLDLMRWLVRLVTPPGGVVLEPFAGSGTTAEACVIEGFRCIAIEREPAYLPLIVARLSKPIALDLFGGAA